MALSFGNFISDNNILTSDDDEEKDIDDKRNKKSIASEIVPFWSSETENIISKDERFAEGCIDEQPDGLFTPSNHLGDAEMKSEYKDNPLIEIQDESSHHAEEEIILLALDMGLVSDKIGEDVGSFDHAPELIIPYTIPHQSKSIQEIHLLEEEVILNPKLENVYGYYLDQEITE